MAMLAVMTLGTPPLFAEEIYQWKDASGGIHFSNLPREGQPSDEESTDTARAADASASFVAEADSAINAVRAEMIRAERQLQRERSDLKAAREELYRIEKDDKESLFPSKADDARILELTDRAANHQDEIRKLEDELGKLNTKLERLVSVKVSGGNELEALAPSEP